MMQTQRQSQKFGAGRRRRRKKKPEPSAPEAPVLIAARRPDSPRLLKVPNRSIAASAKPRKNAYQSQSSDALAVDTPSTPVGNAVEAETNGKPRRLARIVQANRTALDDAELLRQRLLERLLLSEGRSAITRAADALLEHSVAVPEEQELQLQLLEHVDERRARDAMAVLERLFRQQVPIKRPILEQRLRRLEDEAEEAETRVQAESLRRSIRVS